MLLKLLLALLLLYCAVAAALFFAQTSVIFPSRLVPPAGPLPPGAERIAVVASDGVRLEGVLIKPMRPDTSRTAILGFAGNASNAAGIAEFLHAIYPWHSVVAFHYRGYRPSGGSARAAALLEDAPLLFDFARKRLDPERVVVVGISIGSGVATGLSARRPVDGLILVTPFDSLGAVARDKVPWLPVSLLFRHEMASADYLSNSPVPVAIVAAERDSIIPPRRTEALRKSIGNLVHSVTIEGTEHNDIALHPRFAAEMHESLRAVLGAGKTR